MATNQISSIPTTAKLLIFNLKGKAIEDVLNPDRIYMAQYFKASLLRRWSEEDISSLAMAYRMDEAKGISHEWEKYAPCGPLYVREAEPSATKGGNPANPTPAA
jgi:hypothetical protein